MSEPGKGENIQSDLYQTIYQEAKEKKNAQKIPIDEELGRNAIKNRRSSISASFHCSFRASSPVICSVRKSVCVCVFYVCTQKAQKKP